MKDHRFGSKQQKSPISKGDEHAAKCIPSEEYNTQHQLFDNPILLTKTNNTRISTKSSNSIFENNHKKRNSRSISFKSKDHKQESGRKVKFNLPFIDSNKHWSEQGCDRAPTPMPVIKISKLDVNNPDRKISNGSLPTTVESFRNIPTSTSGQGIQYSRALFS